MALVKLLVGPEVAALLLHPIDERGLVSTSSLLHELRIDVGAVPVLAPLSAWRPRWYDLGPPWQRPWRAVARPWDEPPGETVYDRLRERLRPSAWPAEIDGAWGPPLPPGAELDEPCVRCRGRRIVGWHHACGLDGRPAENAPPAPGAPTIVTVRRGSPGFEPFLTFGTSEP